MASFVSSFRLYFLTNPFIGGSGLCTFIQQILSVSTMLAQFEGEHTSEQDTPRSLPTRGSHSSESLGSWQEWGMGDIGSLGAGRGCWPLGWGLGRNWSPWEEKQERGPGLGFQKVLIGPKAEIQTWGMDLGDLRSQVQARTYLSGCRSKVKTARGWAWLSPRSSFLRPPGGGDRQVCAELPGSAWSPGCTFI